MKSLISKLIFLFGCGLNHMAYCATNSTTFGVSASVAANCTFTAASAISFAPYVPNSGNVTATTNILPTCTNGSSYTIGLDAGLATGATVNSRSMQSGGNSLCYQLYSNSNHTTVWGNTVGVNTVAGTGNGVQQPITVYGQIVDNQATVPPGNYTDTITVTINF